MQIYAIFHYFTNFYAFFISFCNYYTIFIPLLNMKRSYNIYFAWARLAISAIPIAEAKRTITLESIHTPQELCRILSIHSCVAIITPTPDHAFAYITSLFRSVTAAGGVVQNQDGLTLMIYRNGRWDIPKGHWEEGESIEECAMREVTEETGVDQLQIQHPICQTTHIYNMRGVWEIKTTHWFKMSTTYTAVLKPQREEGIEQARWGTAQQIEEQLKGAFPTTQEVIATSSGIYNCL